MTKKSFSFIEAPVYQGQKHFGVAMGPSFIRQLLLNQNEDFLNLSVACSQNSSQIQNKIYEELSYIAEREARREQMVFVAGGDHSLSIGTVQGFMRAQPDLKILWIDAHGDINTRRTSLTQSFHGMPLSFLLGLDPHFQQQEWFTETLRPENLIYYGLRDLDRDEKIFLDRLHIQHYSADEVIADTGDRILAQIEKTIKNQNVHISLDVDAFDPEIAPSTGVPVQCGLAFRHVEKLVQKTVEVGYVGSFEYVELNPQIFNSPEDVFKTAQMGIDLFRQALEKHKPQGVSHGFHDRFGDSEESRLFDRYGELEEASSFTY